jgi:hypothetical protein
LQKPPLTALANNYLRAEKLIVRYQSEAAG